METARRKPGRPRTDQRTMPLVLEEDRSLTKVELALPAATAAALVDYASWVQERAKMTAEAALTATADFALRQIFRRDRLWQERRKSPVPAPMAVAPTQPIQVTAPAVLPPPAPGARQVPPPPTAAAPR